MKFLIYGTRRLRDYEGKKLNFGCGDKILRSYINCDKEPYKGVDIRFDFDYFPYPFDDNSFDYILAHYVFEHLKYPEKVLKELWRISKPNAIIFISVPYWNSMLAHTDIDHKHYFSVRSLTRICEPKLFDKKVTLQPYLRIPFWRKLKDFICGIVNVIDLELKVKKEM